MLVNLFRHDGRFRKERLVDQLQPPFLMRCTPVLAAMSKDGLTDYFLKSRRCIFGSTHPVTTPLRPHLWSTPRLKLGVLAFSNSTSKRHLLSQHPSTSAFPRKCASSILGGRGERYESKKTCWPTHNSVGRCFLHSLENPRIWSVRRFLKSREDKVNPVGAFFLKSRKRRCRIQWVFLGCIFCARGT